ncbi:MAG: multiheme c-type cytochrome, partial [Deltaproteobacteria bacterium]|nr:multiheme c-type cytochrome [Deltaproteobacteria bacterium]
MKIFIMIVAFWLFFTYGMGLSLTAQTAQAAKGKAAYVGMTRCKECHPKEVETYGTWKYSKNFRIIQMRKKDRDPNCLRCHTTGFGQPGGFRSVEETLH